MKKIAITTTLTALAALALTACGSEQRPQNPTYNPADSTYTALPTKEVSPETTEDPNNEPNFETTQHYAKMRCESYLRDETTNPDNITIAPEKQRLSEPSGPDQYRTYLEEGTVNFHENGVTSTHEYQCLLGVFSTGAFSYTDNVTLDGKIIGLP
ncbi:MAG: hypothetical protein Q4F10_13030 [Corynebacterium glutamicum]|nr:hypothetical protein [Corynebacterium glutamicum]